MSNSPLVSYTKISPNKTSPRKHEIDTVTIHCVVGQCSIETLGGIFAPTSRSASSNYGIGPDGRIGMYVEESDRSWCSSNSDNDNRAITIEVASDTTDPYAVTDAAYNALIDLLVDICQRNNIKQLLWKADKTLIGQVDKQNMTVHRWFANKSCPGEYLYSRHSQIAAEVNARLGNVEESDDNETVETEPAEEKKENTDSSFKVRVSIDDLNIRKGPGTNYAVTGLCTGKGVFTIVEAKSGTGSTAGWGRLKSGAGWISLDYANETDDNETVETEPAEEKKENTDVPFMVRVSTAYLNIRKGPGTNYATIGSYTDKGVFTITEVKNGTGSTAGWGRLKSGAGWISLDYATRV